MNKQQQCSINTLTFKMKQKKTSHFFCGFAEDKFIFFIFYFQCMYIVRSAHHPVTRRMMTHVLEFAAVVIDATFCSESQKFGSNTGWRWCKLCS